jgi:hypothetical protein
MRNRAEVAERHRHRRTDSCEIAAAELASAVGSLHPMQVERCMGGTHVGCSEAGRHSYQEGQDFI